MSKKLRWSIALRFATLAIALLATNIVVALYPKSPPATGFNSVRLAETYEDKNITAKYPPGWIAKSHGVIQSDASLLPRNVSQFAYEEAILVLFSKHVHNSKPSIGDSLKWFISDPVYYLKLRLSPDIVGEFDWFRMQAMELVAPYKVNPYQVELNHKMFMICIFDTTGYTSHPNFGALYSRGDFYVFATGYTSPSNEATFYDVFQAVLASIEVK